MFALRKGSFRWTLIHTRENVSKEHTYIPFSLRFLLQANQPCTSCLWCFGSCNNCATSVCEENLSDRSGEWSCGCGPSGLGQWGGAERGLTAVLQQVCWSTCMYPTIRLLQEREESWPSDQNEASLGHHHGPLGNSSYCHWFCPFLLGGWHLQCLVPKYAPIKTTSTQLLCQKLQPGFGNFYGVGYIHMTLLAGPQQPPSIKDK